MLDKLKVIEELERSMPALFKESDDELATARYLFNWLIEHPEVMEALKKCSSPHPIPLWEGLLQAGYPVDCHPYPYTVVATDGSQIYPDRHQAVSCYLINTGIVHFSYGHTSSVKLSSVPMIGTHLDEVSLSEDIVNCQRAEQEFVHGLRVSGEVRAVQPDMPFIFLCDGSLIFWHLESKSPQVKERFLKRYIELLDKFYQERIPIAGVISLPKSKEVVALLRNGLAQNIFKSVLQDKNISYSTTVDAIVDTHIMNFFLPEHHRSTVFTHNSAIATRYPEHLRPTFLYLNIGTEIIRIEMPAWVAQDSDLLTRAVRIIKDQCVKGHGYPIVLSEAHEQAVVKAAEREFFFDMLYKMGITYNHRQRHSQKSLKKRFVSV